MKKYVKMNTIPTHINIKKYIEIYNFIRSKPETQAILSFITHSEETLSFYNFTTIYYE